MKAPLSGRRRLAAVSLAAGMVAAGLALAGRDSIGRYLCASDPPAASDAIVVMAGDPGYERTRTAAALVKANMARVLILTGGEQGPGDSAESLRDEAVRLGVAPARIRLETASRSTREAVVAVAPILRELGARTVTVVSSPYHLRRAAAAARRAWPGLTVLARSASPSVWSAEGWWASPGGRRIVVTEYGKLVYYRLRGWI